MRKFLLSERIFIRWRKRTRVAIRVAKALVLGAASAAWPRGVVPGGELNFGQRSSHHRRVCVCSAVCRTAGVCANSARSGWLNSSPEPGDAAPLLKVCTSFEEAPLLKAYIVLGNKSGVATAKPYQQRAFLVLTVEMLGAASATDAADAEKTPFVPAEEKHSAEADAENYPIRRLSFTAALTPRSRATVQQERARKGLIRCCVFAGLVLLLVLGISRAAME